MAANKVQPRPLAERFWEKVDKSPGQGPQGECWEWQASRNKAGYGTFRLNSQTTILAHRLAYELTYGDLGPMQGCHQCDNPACANPAHIFPGTNSDNQKDSADKVRHRGTKQTHCKQGHEYTAANTYTSKAGKRMCKICIKRRSDEATERERQSRQQSSNNP